MKTELLPLWAAIALASAGCTRESAQPSERTRRQAPVSAAPVTVAVAVSKDVPLQIPAIGHVAAFATVAIRSRVDGQLERALFKEGEEVKQGQTIFTIDPRPFEAALHQAEANLAKDAALATNAVVEARREETLFQEGIVPADSSDQARAAADAAQATVVADVAAVESARLQLSFCTITSPIDGRAGKLLVNAGNIVKNNDTVLLVLNQTRPIYLDFSVPEREL